MMKRLSTLHQINTSPTKEELSIPKEHSNKEQNDLDIPRDAGGSQPNNTHLTDEIDKQFSIFTSPTPLKEIKRAVKPIEEPKIQRVPREKVTNVEKKLSTTEDSEDSDSDDDDTMIMVAPLQVNRIFAHDGGVHHQPLEDTTDVIVRDRSEILVPKGKSRPSIESFWDMPTDEEPIPKTPILSHNSELSRSSFSPSELLSLRVRTLLQNNFTK